MERERAHWIIAGGFALVLATGGLHAYWVLLAANTTAEGWASAGGDEALRNRAGEIVRLHGKVVRAESVGGDRVVATLNDGTGRFTVPLEGVRVRSGQWLLATYVWDPERASFVLDTVKEDVQPEMVAAGYGAGVVGIGLGLAVRPRRSRGRGDDDPLPGEWGNLIKWRPPTDPQAVATSMRAPAFSRGPAPGLEGEAIGAALSGLGAVAEAPSRNPDAPSPAQLAAERVAKAAEAAADPAPPTPPAFNGPHVTVALAEGADALRAKLDMVESLLEQRGLVTGFRYGEREAAYALADGVSPEDVLSVLALAGVPLADT